MATEVLRFGVLGPLQITVNDVSFVLGPPAQRAVLAMLVINRNQPVEISALMRAVWAGGQPLGAQAIIESHISSLRALLRDAKVDPRPILIGGPAGYSLNVRESDCDVGVFILEKNAGMLAAAAGRFEQASRHLSTALAQWRGPVLDDLREFEFAGAFASVLGEDRVLAQIISAEAEIACDRGATVISELEALTDEHPYREPVWVQLITAYYVAGRREAALGAYRRLKQKFAEHLGVDPGPAARALHERILRQEALDVKESAKSTAAGLVTILDGSDEATVAALIDKTGRRHALKTGATQIGRLDDNDIVLDDSRVSRHHAVVIDTGTKFIINDLRSANGVYVQHKRIHTSATLNDGDHIRICDHEFTFAKSSGDRPRADSS